jgi:FixJ family two-component response regulator
MNIAQDVGKDKARVLLLEDEAGIRRSLQLLLQASGFDVRAYASGEKLLLDAAVIDSACLVADYRLDEGDGIDTLVRLREKGWQGPAVLITGFPSADLISEARSAGFDAVLEKPLRQRTFVNIVQHLISGSGASNGNL